MQMIEVQFSSNIAAIGYDDVTQQLRVRFHNGSEYEYEGVPLEIYEAFMSAPSKGKFFGAQIRGRYETRKVS